MFIVGHVIFMAMHLVVWNTPGLLDSVQSDFSIVQERGFAETFQYIKTYWLVVTRREFGYLAWRATFLYLGLDDLLEIHEEGGNSIAIRYSYPEILGLRPRDLGELTVLAVAGIVALALIGIAYAAGSDRFRQVCRSLFELVALFALFGIVIDALHIVFLHQRAGALFRLIEDGGEMLILSLIVWYVWRLVRMPQPLDGEQHQPALG